MKNIYFVFSLFYLLLSTAPDHLIAQQIINYNSTGSVPQLRLVEETDDVTARLFFQNLNLPNEKWSLAGKLGTDPTFGLFYNGSSRLFYDEKERLFRTLDDVYVRSSSNNSDLSITLGLTGGAGGTGYGSIYFEDELDGVYAQIRALSDQSNSAIEKHLTLSGAMDNGVGSNYLTLWDDYTTVGSEAVELVDPARFTIAHLASATNPHLTLYQKNNAGYARMFFMNINREHNFSLDASPDRDSPAMRAAYDDDEILRIVPTIINPFATAGGRVGINDDSPTFALELADSPADNLGRGRARSWNTYSDKRVKSDIQSVRYGINEVMMLRPVSYKHHSSEFVTGELQILDDHREEVGFLAQDIYEIIPEVVYKPEDATKDLWSVSYSNIIPVLTKAIQEQQDMIEDMRREIGTLKSQLIHPHSSSR